VGVTGYGSSRGLMWAVKGGVVSLPPGERTLVPFGQESGWPPEPVWTFQKRMKPRLAIFRTVIPQDITDINNNSLSDIRYTCVYLYITMKCKQLEIIKKSVPNIVPIF
jgi:hypothetical protein